MRNSQVMDLIYQVWGEQLPSRALLEDPSSSGYGRTRYLVVLAPDWKAEAHEGRLGGLFTSPEEALKNVERLCGRPQWLLDLNAESQEEALLPFTTGLNRARAYQLSALL